MSCDICKRLELANIGENPEFVIKLKTGMVFLLNSKFYPGYTIFTSLIHENELFKLPLDFRQQFLMEMSQVAQAVYEIYSPIKINYELLGNSQSHLHWHIIPRYKDDPNISLPVWIDINKTHLMNKKPTSKSDILKLKKAIEVSIQKVLL